MNGYPQDPLDVDLDGLPLSPEAAWIRRRERFYERALGPFRQPSVYHWEDDRNPHIDIYAIRAAPPATTEYLVTGGAADRPLPGIPPGDPRPRRVELLVELPRAGDWAAMILREIAAVAFAFGLPLADGVLLEGTHAVVSGSELEHALLVAEEAPRLAGFLVDGEEVRFLRVLFVTRAELELGKAEGPSVLVEKLAAAGADGVQDVHRGSVV